MQKYSRVAKTSGSALPVIDLTQKQSSQLFLFAASRAAHRTLSAAPPFCPVSSETVEDQGSRGSTAPSLLSPPLWADAEEDSLLHRPSLCHKAKAHAEGTDPRGWPSSGVTDSQRKRVFLKLNTVIQQSQNLLKLSFSASITTLSQIKKRSHNVLVINNGAWARRVKLISVVNPSRISVLPSQIFAFLFASSCNSKTTLRNTRLS